jgi:predicted metal-dependent hydrolase
LYRNYIMINACEWPPPFTLRYSPRARSVSLKICARRGLELIVPRHFDPTKTSAVLQQHKKWIERTWRRIQPQINAVHEPEASPQQVRLQALNETWFIDYLPEKKSSALWKELPERKRLIVHADHTSSRKVKKILSQWLKQCAQLHLIPWLEKVSQQTGLLYAHANVRHATTRWGSCSAHKAISLNSKLLFLPTSLVEYILVHELCHTVHLNHARQFWDLVKQFSPNCHTLRKQLKQANRYIPLWTE